MRLHYYIPVTEKNCDKVLRKLFKSGYVMTFDNRKYGGRVTCLEVNIKGGVAVFGGPMDVWNPFVISSDQAIEIRKHYYDGLGCT